MLATQCLLQRKAKTFAITVDGPLAPGVGAKDVVLHIIGVIGVNGGTGHVIEFRGSTIEAMDMEQRMTLCNMSIEAGARAGMVAPDQVTFDFVANTPRGPKGADFEAAVARWQQLRSDARFDSEVRIDATDIRPTLTWGTHPGTAIAVDAPIPAANDAAAQKGLDYMHFQAGKALAGTPVDVVFVGSCTNGRLSDMREVAQVLRGRRVAERVRMLVVPGSEIVKREAEAEGIHEIVRAAGAEWREPGCSMCIAMNGDLVAPGQLAVSTSNRNFEGRQGPGSHPAGFADERGVGASTGTWPIPANCSHRRWRDGRFPYPDLGQRGAAPDQHRHRPDHPGTVPVHHRACRPGPQRVQ